MCMLLIIRISSVLWWILFIMKYWCNQLPLLYTNYSPAWIYVDMSHAHTMYSTNHKTHIGSCCLPSKQPNACTWKAVAACARYWEFQSDCYTSQCPTVGIFIRSGKHTKQLKPPPENCKSPGLLYLKSCMIRRSLEVFIYAANWSYWWTNSKSQL